MDEPVRPEDKKLFDQLYAHFSFISVENIRRQILETDSQLPEQVRYDLVVAGFRSQGHFDRYCGVPAAPIEVNQPNAEAGIVPREQMERDEAPIEVNRPNAEGRIVPSAQIEIDVPPRPQTPRKMIVLPPRDPARFNFVLNLLVSTMPEVTNMELLEYFAHQYQMMSEDMVFDVIAMIREKLYLPSSPEESRISDWALRRRQVKRRRLNSEEKDEKQEGRPGKDELDSRAISSMLSLESDKTFEASPRLPHQQNQTPPRVPAPNPRRYQPPGDALKVKKECVMGVLVIKEDKDVDWAEQERQSQLPGNSGMTRMIYPKQPDDDDVLPRIMCPAAEFEELLSQYHRERSRNVVVSPRTPESKSESSGCADSKVSKKLVGGTQTSLAPNTKITIRIPSSTATGKRLENTTAPSCEAADSKHIVITLSPEEWKSFFAPASAADIQAAREANKESKPVVVTSDASLTSESVCGEGREEPEQMAVNSEVVLQSKKIVRFEESSAIPSSTEESICSAESKVSENLEDHSETPSFPNESSRGRSSEESGSGSIQIRRCSGRSRKKRGSIKMRSSNDTSSDEEEDRDSKSTEDSRRNLRDRSPLE